MRGLLELLLNNPILIFILLAWVAGAIGNAAKAAKKRKVLAETQRRMPQVATRTTGPAEAGAPAGSRSAEDIAAEMRRILGMEEPPRRAHRTGPAVAPPPAPAPPPRVRRNVVEPERPPVAVAPKTQARKLDLHAESHVGDSMQHRSLATNLPQGHRLKRADIGSLGGRVHEVAVRRRTVHRFAIDDLKKAIVLNEILSPPLALRGRGEMRPL